MPDGSYEVTSWMSREAVERLHAIAARAAAESGTGVDLGQALTLAVEGFHAQAQPPTTQPAQPQPAPVRSASKNQKRKPGGRLPPGTSRLPTIEQFRADSASRRAPSEVQRAQVHAWVLERQQAGQPTAWRDVQDEVRRRWGRSRSWYLDVRSNATRPAADHVPTDG